MRSNWQKKSDLDFVLRALTEENRLVCEVCLATGLRVGDVLKIKTEQFARGQRVTVREQKTGKSRRVFINERLRRACLAAAGKEWLFPGRNGEKPRTRQAVWKDMRRVASALRLKHATPHSLRKAYAVDEFSKSRDLAAVQKKLNHSDPTITLLYALADQMAKKS